MNKINFFWILIFIVVSFSSCKNDNLLNIHLPNGKSIPQATITEIEKNYECNYEQYVGFVMNYEDTLLSNPILILENRNEIVGSEILGKEKMQHIKTNKVQAIKFTFKLSQEERERDTLFEAYIKNCYKDYDEEIKNKNGFELKKGKKDYVVVELHTFGNPNYSVLIYPVK